jgi:hypothetical protein
MPDDGNFNLGSFGEKKLFQNYYSETFALVGIFRKIHFFSSQMPENRPFVFMQCRAVAQL